METPYTYLFIRKDLTGPQRIVQTAHAAHEAGEHFGRHSHMTLLGINDEQDLLKAAAHLDRNGIKYRMFFEPDYDTGYTAIATEPLRGEQRQPLRRYSLLRE